MKCSIKFFASIVLLLLAFSGNSVAQWSSDPAANLQICDVTGEQALPKIASTSDGGCYIAWFDNRSGGYAVYMQLLDAMGYKMWAEDGLLISNNPQSSSLVDWAIATDAQDNAIVTFTDTRDNDSLHAFAYLVNTNGDMLWGANGIRLSGVGDFQPNPVACQTSDGNYVFAWIVATDTQKIALQKISPAGEKLWGANPIIYASGTAETYTYPALMPSDNGTVILIHTGYTGPFWSAQMHVYAQKFDQDGNTMWGSTSIAIQNTGGMPFYVHPGLISDGNNGVFVTWYDDRDFNNLFSSFVQHITSAGTLSFPADGAEVSTTVGMHHIYPAIGYVAGGDYVYAFWLEEAPNQDQFAVYGQKFDASGNRQWTNGGIQFTDMTSNAIYEPSVLATDTSLYVIYLQGNQSGVNTGVYALMISTDGEQLWNPNIVTMSNPTPNKLHEVTTIWTDDIAKITWEDTRTGAAGIYAQNINPNGELGNIIVPVELTSFTGTLNGSTVTLNWQTATELNNRGFDVERAASSVNWKSIGFVQGNGTSTVPHTYTFSDANLEAGTYSYRLKQIDNDGAVKFINLSESFTVQPAQYSLSQNYPNPFNPATVIKYSIPENNLVTLKIYNVLGSQVAELVNEVKSAGSYEVNFNASGLSSGVYYYTISAGKFCSTRKMILMK